MYAMEMGGILIGQWRNSFHAISLNLLVKLYWVIILLFIFLRVILLLIDRKGAQQDEE